VLLLYNEKLKLSRRGSNIYLAPKMEILLDLNYTLRIQELRLLSQIFSYYYSAQKRNKAHT